MMATSLHLLMVAAMFVSTLSELTCPCWRIPPSKRNCPQLTDEDCPEGFTNDACACCQKCANTIGDKCGGQWRSSENCEFGLYCLIDGRRRVDFAPYEPLNGRTGICTPEIKDFEVEGFIVDVVALPEGEDSDYADVRESFVPQ